MLSRTPRSNLDGEALYDSDSSRFQSTQFLRIVGEHADASHSQVLKDGCTCGVVALVGAEAKLLIGLYRVSPFILELVSEKFVQEPDPPALLRMINDDAASSPVDLTHGKLQLVPAITACRGEDVASQALGVNTH